MEVLFKPYFLRASNNLLEFRKRLDIARQVLFFDPL